ncbi:TRAM domain-containing protein [Candidatus Micrarchaeota archaeon]|nr:TRAM domain-containing protein [Candidatus Micrarchaeota archaeon]MBU1165444.1 TRAM domain-containing protein [Candidatus Micrarchaeota archaeon]MBU1887425.1 TRAM domain-containing protein [Candidatus Micrarchaeota archaeon]
MEDTGKKNFDIPKPVSAGDEIDITIESEGGKGDGIAKVDGFVIFVKDAKKGENCKVRIAEVKRTYAIGEKIGEASAVKEDTSKDSSDDSEDSDSKDKRNDDSEGKENDGSDEKKEGDCESCEECSCCG